MVQLNRYDPNTAISNNLVLNALNQNALPSVLLQTCNRLELYSGDGQIERPVVEHLFRVVTGLQSGLIGETGIQFQVKTAYLRALEQKKTSPSLNRLFQAALNVGKIVRTATGISIGAMSHSQAVVKLLHQKLPEFTHRQITVLGVHRMNHNLLHHLKRAGAHTIYIGNRTFHHAHEMAQKYDATAFDYTMLKSRLAQTDVLISATAAPHHIVTAKNFPLEKPMMIFDLAVPSDVDPALSLLPGVTLYQVSDVEAAIEQNLKKRQTALVQAEALVQEETARFMENEIRRLQFIQLPTANLNPQLKQCP